MTSQVPWVSTADSELGLVAQEGVALLPLRELGRENRPRAHSPPPSPPFTFFRTGTAKKQVTTAGVSRARCGMFKGHMPLRL